MLFRLSKSLTSAVKLGLNAWLKLNLDWRSLGWKMDSLSPITVESSPVSKRWRSLIYRERTTECISASFQEELKRLKLLQSLGLEVKTFCKYMKPRVNFWGRLLTLSKNVKNRNLNCNLHLNMEYSKFEISVIWTITYLDDLIWPILP